MRDKVNNDEMTLKQLTTISEKERYRIIGKLKLPQNIARALNEITDDTVRRKTFNFIAKQFKGNCKGLLEIIAMLDFPITIPPNMLIFTLNNLNVLDLDFLINLKNKIENHSQVKFKINEDDDSRNIEYSFGEISAIVAKIEELTAGIPKEMDEANKFYTIYSRVTKMITYDHMCIKRSKDAKERLKYSKTYTYRDHEYHKKEIRKDAAGLYGGLVDGKAICAGYALILCQALRYVGMKSQYVSGYKPGAEAGHAWTQVQIDGEWYNADPTWDSEYIQMFKEYRYMLQSDQEFEKTHGEFYIVRNKNYRQCKSDFDYNKIQGNCPVKKQVGKVI